MHKVCTEVIIWTQFVYAIGLQVVCQVQNWYAQSLLRSNHLDIKSAKSLQKICMKLVNQSNKVCKKSAKRQKKSAQSLQNVKKSLQKVL